ncbi:hypothetical protein GWK47_053088 [Chionoecetes opilio]|uniref:Uncharacterized protein n=1 Tax=Chionoecetes opilio TaxID=41210 RepID=A0A8J5CR23_CHIOP|nr:hypothetical protein GWK47_053088 [Chionoecetes opilio]
MSFATEYRNHIRAQEREENRNVDTDQAHRAAAHNAAFNLVVEHIQKHIVEHKQIIQLSTLRLIYITELEQQHFPNQDYRSEKLMNRLKNHDISDKIEFIKRVNYRMACYKRAHQPIFPRPKPYDAGQGWEKTGQGILEPVWLRGPILPSSLTDLLETVDSEEEEEDLVEKEYPDYDGLDDGNDE